MICITGGGTGGHLRIAQVFKEELNKQGIKPLFIGSTYGLDREWFENDEGFEARYFLETEGVVNKRGMAKLISLGNILKKLFYVRKLFKKHGIKKVISVGGYSAAPASFCAVMLCMPLYIHEQNSLLGRLNRLLKPFSKRLFSSFAYGDPYPVSDSFFDKARVRTEVKTLIFLGGSQGAKAINDLAMACAQKSTYRIIHQCGKHDFERVKAFYETHGLEVDFFAFDKDIVGKIASADVAISRAGASTLFELVSNQIPTIFIPFPHAAANHQYFNAKFLVDQRLAQMIEEKEANCEKVLESIHTMRTKEVSKKLGELNTKEGTKEIIVKILK